MTMGSRMFCVINIDGSLSSMAVGGDLKAYQTCLIHYKDAWKTGGYTGTERSLLAQAQLQRMKDEDERVDPTVASSAPPTARMIRQ